MWSPRPFDSGDEKHHISTHLLWRHPILPRVPESVQLCQAQPIPSPIMATNGDAGRGKLATRSSRQEPATGAARGRLRRRLRLLPDRVLIVSFVYSVRQLGRCLRLQVHREGHQARQDEGQEDRQSVHEEEGRRYRSGILATRLIYMLINIIQIQKMARSTPLPHPHPSPN